MIVTLEFLIRVKLNTYSSITEILSNSNIKYFLTLCLLKMSVTVTLLLFYILTIAAAINGRPNMTTRILNDHSLPTKNLHFNVNFFLPFLSLYRGSQHNLLKNYHTIVRVNLRCLFPVSEPFVTL